MNNSRKIDGSLNVIGNKIKYYREKNNLSYQKLSDKLMLLGVDIHKQAIYNIEVGKRTIVDYELCAFAKCFGISVNDLTDEFFNKLYYFLLFFQQYIHFHIYIFLLWFSSF